MDSGSFKGLASGCHSNAWSAVDESDHFQCFNETATAGFELFPEVIGSDQKLRISYRRAKEIQRQEGVMKANSEIGKATYFGIEVEILVQLDHCSLVGNQDREFVVDTAELTQKLSLAKAA